MSKKILNGPTILTLLRIILVIPLMLTIFLDSLPAQIAAIACFVIASATDFVDGRWARKQKLVTDLGAFLDPLADKMLVNLTFLALVVMNLVPFWIFAIILVRDFAIDGLRMLAAHSKITLAASKYGKAKTMLQMFTLTSILLNRILMNPVLATINLVLLYGVLAFTIFSGADYLLKSKQLLTR